MIINHNMNAVNAHRNMMSNINHAGKSMEKLSSGLRINRAGDDAAGLAISEKMRGQIRGLDQAARNSQDGISMIQTAEGALNETHSILQRMRELSTQAANDTNTSEDRGQIQNEMNQLTSEINRIGNTTEFNTQKVLDGGTAAKADAAGDKEIVEAVAGKFEFELGTVANDDVIKIDGVTFTKKAATDTAAGEFADAAGLKSAIEANDELKAKYDVTEDSGTFTLTQKEGTESATEATIEATIADVTAKGTFDSSIKTVTEGVATPVAVVEGGAVEAKEATGATVTGTKLAGTTLAAVTDLKINGTKVVLTNTKALDASGAADKAATPENVAAALQKDIDAVADLKGKFTVSKNEAGGVDIKTVATGADATLKLEDSTSGDLAELGLTVADEKGTDAVEAKEAEVEAFTATLQIGANKGQAFKITIKDMRSEALGISKKVEVGETTEAGEATEAVEATAATAVAAQAGTTATDTLTFDAGVENGAKANDVKIEVKAAGDDTLVAGYDETTNTLTVSLSDTTLANNTETTIQKAITDLGTKGDIDFSKFTVKGAGNFVTATGSLAKVGTTTFTLADGVDATEATEATEAVTAFAKEGHVTNGTTDEEVETSLDMSSHDSATAAIKVLDEAINKVSTERSTLGSYQNRLEHTINNLGTSSENLTAAESRVRDVDMAKEMMTFSKDNILQQAAQAMLAQAKQQPQGVLQLLR